MFSAFNSILRTVEHANPFRVYFIYCECEWIHYVVDLCFWAIALCGQFWNTNKVFWLCGLHEWCLRHCPWRTFEISSPFWCRAHSAVPSRETVSWRSPPGSTAVWWSTGSGSTRLRDKPVGDIRTAACGWCTLSPYRRGSRLSLCSCSEESPKGLLRWSALCQLVCSPIGFNQDTITTYHRNIKLEINLIVCLVMVMYLNMFVWWGFLVNLSVLLELP